jgi:hypothetical protein
MVPASSATSNRCGPVPAYWSNQARRASTENGSTSKVAWSCST